MIKILYIDDDYMQEHCRATYISNIIEAFEDNLGTTPEVTPSTGLETCINLLLEHEFDTIIVDNLLKPALGGIPPREYCNYFEDVPPQLHGLRLLELISSGAFPKNINKVTVLFTGIVNMDTVPIIQGRLPSGVLSASKPIRKDHVVKQIIEHQNFPK